MLYQPEKLVLETHKWAKLLTMSYSLNPIHISEHGTSIIPYGKSIFLWCGMYSSLNVEIGKQHRQQYACIMMATPTKQQFSFNNFDFKNTSINSCPDTHDSG
jgi:hypothetical protein